MVCQNCSSPRACQLPKASSNYLLFNNLLYLNYTYLINRNKDYGVILPPCQYSFTDHFKVFFVSLQSSSLCSGTLSFSLSELWRGTLCCVNLFGIRFHPGTLFNTSFASALWQVSPTCTLYWHRYSSWRWCSGGILLDRPCHDSIFSQIWKLLLPRYR